jgi:putative transposase
MKKSKFSEAQMIGALKEVEGGAKVDEVCRKLGIAPNTFYRWRAKFGGMNVSEAQRLKQLDDENRKLKEMVADLSLDLRVVKEALRKKW